MYKKACCTCKLVVLLKNPIVFLTFSLPSPSSLLKLPNGRPWERLALTQRIAFPMIPSAEPKSFQSHVLGKRLLERERNGFLCQEICMIRIPQLLNKQSRNLSHKSV